MTDKHRASCLKVHLQDRCVAKKRLKLECTIRRDFESCLLVHLGTANATLWLSGREELRTTKLCVSMA